MRHTSTGPSQHQFSTITLITFGNPILFQSHISGERGSDGEYRGGAREDLEQENPIGGESFIDRGNARETPTRSFLIVVGLLLTMYAY
eukprot:1189352-Prorocentrum_minimum.AAC.9